ncbi:unnamed protein product [Adineta ricciae]|uniref:NAD(P)(+)--arginine ADP-ribosyltransferase n=1 Tax=Adineta ricciae TaxID=249248 RepID=A0A815R1D2_ADIRI|nr:unnamed protein product [Adineta ricciae]CAF1612041.1 unnamed protein product [Adineta ricciae]
MTKDCSSCGIRLRNSTYYSEDGNWYCTNCYDIRFRPTCTKCHQKIKSDQKGLKSNNTNWHNDCFNCARCNKSLVHLSSSYTKNDQPYCSNCYQMKFLPKCNECGETIKFDDRSVTFRGNELHTQCFKCSSCRITLGTQIYYEHNGNSYCRKCDNEKFCPKCSQCNVPISRGINYSKIDGSIMHSTCFTCFTCGNTIGGKYREKYGHYYHPYCDDKSNTSAKTLIESPKPTIKVKSNKETSDDFTRPKSTYRQTSASSKVSEISEFYNACRDNNIDFVKRKLKTMTIEEINQIEPNGSTALHVASYRGHEEIVDLLLENGASHMITNRYQNTPLDEAKTERIRKLFHNRRKKTRFISDFVEWIISTDNADFQSNIFLKKLETYGKDFDLNQMIIHIKENYLPKLLKYSLDLQIIEEYFDLAIKGKDPLQLLKAYTTDTEFYSSLNINLAKLHLENLTEKENLDQVYFIGIIAHHPKLDQLSFTGTIYRGMIINNDNFKQYKIGTKILTKTFSSASKNRNIAFRFLNENIEKHCQLNVICIYQIRNNRTALDIEHISIFKDEEEVLILPFSAFKIIDIQTKDHKSIQVEITLKECEPW